MADLRKQFLKALEFELEKAPWGFKKTLAAKAGVSANNLSSVLSGRASPEETRRAIAAALDYDYDVFIERGRVLLEGGDPTEVKGVAGETNKPVIFPEWLLPLLPDLASLSDHEQTSIKTFLSLLISQKNN
jgi:transcriptional regulator with XRE-family HTH domain